MRLFDWLGGKKKKNLSITPRAASPSVAPQKQQSPSPSPAPKPPEKPVATTAPKPEAAPTAAPPSGGNAQMTRLMVSRDFPPEITKGRTREQVSELIRASGRYMWTALGTYLSRDGVKFSDEKTSGVTDPSAASMMFETSIATADEAQVTKYMGFYWDRLIEAIQKHGGIDGFCAEYRKERSTPTKFNPHKPICDKCGRDLNPSPLFRVGDHYSGYICKTCKKVLCPGCGPQTNCPDCGTKLNDAGLQNLMDLAHARQAAAQGTAVIEALAVVISPTTGERAEAIEWFDAIASAISPPPCSFDLVIAEGPKIYMTAVICFFDSSNGTPKPEGSIHDHFLPWLKAAAGNRTWYTQEAYGPQTYPPGTILKLEGYFAGIQILRHKRIAPSK
jgi:hypothetical protein